MDTICLPIFDVLSGSTFLPILLQRGNIPDYGEIEESQSNFLLECRRLASCLEQHGALLIRDPRCTLEHNSTFLDMLEKYFAREDATKMREARPHLHFQVGVTPEGFEVPRSAIDPEMRDAIFKQPAQHRAHAPTGADKKWRYMWRVGPRPQKSKFKELNAEPVVPEGFPDWSEVMDGWGHKMMAAVEATARMAAIGFGLPCNAFTSLMHQGPHLLAPTGSNLERYCEEGTILAGYHYDFNLLTIHGKSRYPGLFIWLRDGTKLAVKVPDGCLLVQAGKQLEWLTGGKCQAGMHEVVVSQSTIQAVESAKLEGRSLWRVSSTLFAHVASDAVLQPLGHFANSSLSCNYPATLAGDFAEAELAAINLKQKSVDTNYS